MVLLAPKQFTPFHLPRFYHRSVVTPTMSYENKRPDVAVFIDFENVYVSVRDKLDANPNFEAIMDRCNDLGRVVIARAYADWYRYPRVTSALYANGIEPMYVPTYYYDKEMGRTGRAIKNSVDMNLCIDAMKTLFTNTNIGRFVLATGDRDFIPLVNSIRQQGKEVIIIGIGGAASTHLAQSADEFVFYEQLVGKATPAARHVRAAAAAEPPARVADVPAVAIAVEPAPAAPTAEPVHLVRKRGYVSTLGSLKLVMKELMGGDFKESRYKDLSGRPFVKFKDFVMDAEKRGKVQIFTSGTVNEVFLPGEDPAKLSQFAADLKEEPSVEPMLDVAVLSNGRKEQPKARVATPAETATTPAPAGRRRRRRRGGRSGGLNLHEVPMGSEDDGEELEPLVSETAEAAPEAVEASAEGDVVAETVAPEAATAEAPEVTLEATPEASVEAPVAGAEAAPEASAEAAEAVAEPPAESKKSGKGRAKSGSSRSRKTTKAKAAEAESAAPEAVAAPEAATPVVETAAPAAPELAPEPAAAEPTEVAAPVAAESISEPVADEAEDGLDSGGADEMIAFTEDEWQIFNEMMRGFSKPVSFVQMFDALRNLRTQNRIGRTNEQLRTMAKQSINQGMVERVGRGKRVYYRLKEETPAEG